MALQDTTANEYLMDPERFADLLNAVANGGRPVIHASDVQGISTVLSRIWWDAGKLKAQTNIADVSGTVIEGSRKVRVHLQNQTKGSFIMPVRVMNVDSIDYYNQWKGIGKKHGEMKDLRTPAEKFSGFSREDELCGVASIVLYYGRLPWVGARSLKQLLGGAKRTEKTGGLVNLIADYPVNLLEVRRFAHPEFFRSDLRQVFTFLQKDNDKETLIKYVDENEDFFHDMPEDAYDFLTAMSHIGVLKRKRKRYIDKKRRRGNMCKALRDLAKDCRAEGRAEGRAKGRAEGRAEEWEQINTLGLRMKAENRIDDFFRSLSDMDYREKLLREYGMAAK